MLANSSNHSGRNQDDQAPLPGDMPSKDGIDIALLEESLSKTVWERMLANDDALRLADLLQTATMKSRAKP